jgi:Response regulator with putative antiterminator output domain
VSASLRIAIAEDEQELLTDLQEILVEMGHQVVAAVRSGTELITACQATQPDMIITDIKMPGLDGLGAVTKISEVRPTPVIILSAYHDQEYVDRAIKDHVMAYLVKPINESSLKASIELASCRFKEFQALQQHTSDLEQALQERKVIERAKGVLMKRASLSEPDAFRRLQLLSSQKNKKMIEIAKMIVDAEEAFMG